MQYSTQEKVNLIAGWLLEKKADYIVTLDVRDKCSFTEYLIICSGQATIHNTAIANFIIDQAKVNKIPVLSKEGLAAATWILLDLNDVIVHIFMPEIRDVFQIEDLWTKRPKDPDNSNP